MRHSWQHRRGVNGGGVGITSWDHLPEASGFTLSGTQLVGVGTDKLSNIQNAVLIDLNAMSKAFYEALGPASITAAFSPGDASSSAQVM